MKKYIPAVIVTFLLYVFFMWIIHSLILGQDYATLGGMFREEIMWPHLLIGHIIFAIAFVYIYSKGVEATKPWFGQAICYGVSVWLLIGLSVAFVAYAVTTTPVTLLVWQSILNLIAVVILAMPVAYMYRK